MPFHCCVPKCKTIGGHRFPRDPLRKAEWVKAIWRDNFIPDKTSRVCKSHFVPVDYATEQNAGARSFLKKDAVPSQFLWTNSSSEQDREVQEVKGKIKIRHRKIPEKRKLLLQKRRAARKRKMNESEANEVNQDISSEKDSEKFMNIEAVHSQADIPEGNVTDNLPDVTKTEGRGGDNVDTAECRACLQQLRIDQMFGLFQGWASNWEGLGTTVAEDLINLTDVQLSETDIHSKFICYTCCEKLWNACHFKMLAQGSNRTLWQRIPEDTDRVWPKPIQVDKSINGFDLTLPFEIDIKQEVLSDEEACNIEEGYTDVNVMEIKVEPEEFVEQQPILVNGVTSLKEFPVEENASQLLNGDNSIDEHLQAVKEEPVSDGEDTTLPLECLLCMRSFHSVTGLKAHVIAQHSYQTVGRAGAGAGSPLHSDVKHACATCRRTFATSTDLMVHETCHNKHVCYGCSAKFETFSKLSVHRRRCKALSSAEGTRLKTLDDVIRPPADDLLSVRPTKESKNSTANEDGMFECPTCNKSFSDMYYVRIHQEVHHSDDKKKCDASPMEVEVLESLFNEDT